LQRYYRPVTQLELIGGGVDRARAGVNRAASTGPPQGEA
jgi:hypothetical protein